MRPLPRHSRLPLGTGGSPLRWAAGLVGLFSLLPLAPLSAEELLTRVLYTEGSSSYTLLEGNGSPAAGKENTSLNLLTPGMSLASLAQIETSGDGKIMIGPIPQIRYVVYPKSRVVNEALSYHAEDSDHTIDYKLRVVEGIVVGDIQGLPHNIGSEIEAPLGNAFTPNGHFMVAVRPDGSTKYGVLTGSLTVNLSGRGTYTLTANQVLNVLSETEKAKILADHQGEIVGGSPADVERQEGVALLNQGGEDLKITSLQADAEALAILTDPMPAPNDDQFSNPPTAPQLVLFPGQLSPYYNPGNFFNPGSGPNPANTANNPPVSPIFP